MGQLSNLMAMTKGATTHNNMHILLTVHNLIATLQQLEVALSALSICKRLPYLICCIQRPSHDHVVFEPEHRHDTAFTTLT
jgi:hypothetical protein